MGNTISNTIFSFLQYIGLYTKEATIAVIGLDNAGKTTMLYRIQNGKIIQLAPSQHVNEETFSFGGISFKAYDIGGQESFRLLWKRFLGNVDAILFLIDASDSSRFNEVKTEIEYLAEQETVKTIPVGILMNKCDKRDQFPIETIIPKTSVQLLLDANNNAMTSALRPESLTAVLTWLASVV